MARWVHHGVTPEPPVPPPSADAPLRVLRLCSVYEPPPSALDGRAAGFDPIGGMQDHTARLSRLLERRGVVQVVLTARPPTAPWVERPSPRLTVIRVALPVRRPRQLYALPAALLAPLLGRRADVVHAHLGEDLAILPLAVLAARAGGSPLVVTVHCSLVHTLRGGGARTALLRGLGGPIERWGQRRAALTIAMTRGLAGTLAAELGADRVQFMRRGIDRRAFADPGPHPPDRSDPFGARDGRRRIVFLGRVVRGKGVETLVQATARLRTPGAEVVLVGDGPDRVRVERLAARLGVGDRLRITGFVPHERVPAVLGAADVLVLPSFYEELGSVLIEAMQVGLPCVASRVGGIPEVLEDGALGVLVEPGDPGALAAAIDRVLGDAELAARLGAAARRRAPDYDAEEVARQVHDVYIRLTGSRPRPKPLSPPARWTDGLSVRLWPT